MRWTNFIPEKCITIKQNEDNLLHRNFVIPVIPENISQAIDVGFVDICLSGHYSNKGEIVNLTNIAESVSIRGQGTFINNSTLLVDSVSSDVKLLILSDTILQETEIIVGNIVVLFIRCKLSTVI